ncbi:acetone carboxylase, alpha subunit [Steroidobacter denitrificans]|uniref:Acetone carboxylase, alpha subunit n=1 Tax=Steroidobacter denitrificans TaxID=465721 RepID=A0A127F749_STEDE|nr:hydantoinase B/oxoprolinase family protein [Steroidobacter denitrificans]AMN46266.1 acetone carboxylase, alpha subunit [Steroidobacter denitrificans]
MTSQLKLKEQLKVNDELFAKTGCMFGLEKLTEKENNPGLYEAVWHILLSVCNTAWEVGCKVSASPVAAEGGDALWALHTPTGECICTSYGITAHVGLLAAMVRKFIEMGYEDSPGFKQGDIFENNDPHYGGIHMPDMDTAMPIFYKGKLVAWASSVTHVADAGAVLPGSINFMNPDTFSDGMPVSLERIGENDRYYPWYELRIKSRTRAPDWVLGDARGRLAGLITVREKLLETIEKYGLEFFEKASREYIEDSRRYAVARIRNQAVPGRVRKSQFKDLTLKGKVVIMPKQDIDLLSNVPMEMRIDANANVHLSLAGASGSVPFGQNITPTALSSALLMGYSHVVGFDMFNSGPTFALTVDTPPPGSWCNPFPVDWFASTGMGWSSAIRWLSSLYEVTGRLYYMRGFVEEMSAGAGTTMAAEWHGTNQYGQYAVCLTLEQASNGSPARGIADGEPAAWCLYTANADFGNAEVMELYYPFMYLGRNMEPDSGGYGKFRGGMGHTTVWMVMNTPEIHYSAACAGANSKITANHGMYGAYPMPGDRVAYAAGTNVKELIEQRKPLVHERGLDPDYPTLSQNIVADVLNNDVVVPANIPETLHEYDLVINPTSGSQAMGDPIERDPALVKDDLDKGLTRPWVAENIHGVIARKEANGDWLVDEDATTEKRRLICEARKQRGVPFREWWQQERKQIVAGANMDEAVKRMWRSSMKLSPGYAAELRAFWNLPADFEF